MYLCLLESISQLLILVDKTDIVMQLQLIVSQPEVGFLIEVKGGDSSGISGTGEPPQEQSDEETHRPPHGK